MFSAKTLILMIVTLNALALAVFHSLFVVGSTVTAHWQDIMHYADVSDAVSGAIILALLGLLLWASTPAEKAV